MHTVHKNPLRQPALVPKSIALAAVCLLSACAQTAPQFDANFGNTVRAAVAQQTLNPDASANTALISGMDGRAAREAIDRYQKSFTIVEPQPSVFTIGVGR